ncbi:MAG: T9SS type A sorting domain-containing protein, partial [Bacteroidota bacterium]
EGDCSTGKIPVTIYVGGTNFVLGNDTIIDIDDTIIINAPTGYSSSLWFDGSNADSIIIVAVNLGYGIHYISLTLTDSLGCQVQDSLIIGVADLVGLQELKTEIYIYPNPTTDKISFSEYIEKVNVYDVTGTKIYSHFEPTNTVFLSDFSDGSYFVEFFFKNKKCIKKVIKNASSN